MLKNLFIFLYLPLIIGGIIFSNKNPSAATEICSSPVKINEISSFSSNDWAELYNLSDTDINILNYSLWDDSAGSYVKKFTTTTTILARNWLLVDMSNRLNKDGDNVILKDDNLCELDRIVYTKNQIEENQTLARATDGSGDWQITMSATAGTANVITAPSATPTSSTSTPPTSSTPIAPTTSSLWLQIKINEFLPDPNSENEWIELFNPATSSLNIAGGTICDGRDSTSCVIVNLNGIIEPSGWLSFNLSGNHLNNDGDSVVLKNPDGLVVDQITYTDSLIPKTGQSLARKIDGFDNNNSSDWAITTKPTNGGANNIVSPAPTINLGASNSGGGSTYSSNTNQPNTTSITPTNNQTPTPSTIWATSTSPLIINELLPNPQGSDLNEEFVEIKNISPNTINLANWKLSNNSKTFSLTGTIVPNGLIIFSRPVTGISLKNSGTENLRLINPSGAIADDVKYETASEGLSYSRDRDKTWNWTEEITKGEPNIIETPDSVHLIWKIFAPKFAAPHELVSFDINGTADPRGGRLFFLWKFNDGTIRTGSDVAHTFATSGVYNIFITASSTAGTTDEKKLTITIGDGLTIAPQGVILSEIFPNPRGTDTQEFIEIYNSSPTSADMSKWQIKNTNSKIFTIPDKTIIPPRDTLIFYRLITHIALDNNKDSVSLISPAGATIDTIDYKKSVDNQSYTRTGQGWIWTPQISPGIIIIPTQISSNTFSKSFSTNVNNPNYNQSTKSPATILNRTKGSWVRITGLVTAAPGTFSDHSFYVTDGQNGMQIYAAKKIFPDLIAGDQVAVAGTVSELKGTPRLLVRNPADIDILATNGTLAPETISLDDLDESLLHNLVTVEGEITKITSKQMFIDDGTAEIIISFKPNAHISKESLTIGSNTKITGLLERPPSGWQIWPRSNDDIQILGPSNEELQKQAALANEKSRQKKIAYLATTIGGLGIIATTWFIKRNFLKT